MVYNGSLVYKVLCLWYYVRSCALRFGFLMAYRRGRGRGFSVGVYKVASFYAR